MRWPLIERLRSTTLRTRLTIWNAAVVIALTAFTLLAVRFAARTVLYADADAELRGASREVALAIEELAGDDARILATLRRKASSHEERGWFLQLLTLDGTTIWRSDHCPDDVTNYPPADVERAETVRQVGHYRYVRNRVDRPRGGPLLVRVGTYTTGLDESLSSLMWLLTTVGVLLSAITPLAGWWLAGRATRPLASILRTAGRLSPTRLCDRLPVGGTGDELDHLATTINGLLDRVARHIDRQERFVADAAHELRGPLAALQSSMEVALARGRLADDDLESLNDMLEAVRHLSKVANDLLLLAEAGQSITPSPFAAIDLGAIAQRAVSMFSGVAEEQGVTLSIDAIAPTGVLGDPIALRRLISNLLDNALRFTPPGGEIRLRVVPLIGEAVMTVADTGQGIAPSDLEHVFERFFKVDPSRSHRQTRSSGLGLAICRSIVEAGGGTIAIESRLGQGTSVTVRLPLAVGHPTGASAALPSLLPPTPQPAADRTPQAGQPGGAARNITSS